MRLLGIIVSLLMVSGMLVSVASPASANHDTRTLEVSPEITSGNVGTAVTLTATLYGPEGAAGSESPATTGTGDINIDFEIEQGPGDTDGNTPATPDLSCNVKPPTATCSVSYTSTTEGDDVIRAWIDHDKNNFTTEADPFEGRYAGPPDCLTEPTDKQPACSADVANPGLKPEPDDTDVVTVDWQETDAARLNCDPERADNPSTGSGSSETYTCTVTDRFGNPVDVEIDGENMNGANDPDNDADGSGDPANPDKADYHHETEDDDSFCDTGSDGVCTGTVEAEEGEAGSAEICFWVDEDADDEYRPDENDQTAEDQEDQAPRPFLDQDDGEDCDTESVDETENTDITDKVIKTWIARSPAEGGVDAEPESDSNNLGQTHEISATVYDQFGEPFVGVTQVKFEFFQGSPSDKDGNTPETPDLTCTTRAPITGAPTSSCTVTYTSNTAGTDLVCVFTNENPAMTGNNTNGTCDGETLQDADDAPGAQDPPEPVSDDQDVVQKIWQDPSAATRLNCEPEQDTNPRGSSHTITCTATSSENDATGSPQRISGVRIDVEATGANDPDNGNSPTSPDFTCTTRSNEATTVENEAGTCTITHGGTGTGSTASTGTTTYRAWIDRDNNDTTVEADMAEARDEVAAPGDEPEPDDTDVVEKTWVLDPETLTISPKTDAAPVGTCNPYTVTVRNQDGGAVEGAIIDVEQRHANADNTTASDEPDVGFCRPSTGPNPSDVDEARGDQVEPGGDNAGTAGGETIQPTDANGQVTFGIRVQAANGSDGTGQVSIVAFYDEGEDNDDPDEGEPQDTATKTWEPGSDARTIDCLPKTDSNPVGTNHVVTCTVRDSQNQPVQGEGVTFFEQGAGQIEGSNTDTSDQNGEVTVTTTSSEPGEQSITGTLNDDISGSEPGEVDECDRAAGDPQGAPAGRCSDTVTKTWVQGQAPACSDGVDNDNDGQTDYPDDPGCESATDDDETDDFPHQEFGGDQGQMVTEGACAGFTTGSVQQDPNGSGLVIVGTNGGDALQGGEAGDLICALEGDDAVQGNGGDDTVYGGAGKDAIEAGDGNDAVFGEGDKDVILGDAGIDNLRGGQGNDNMSGGAGADELRGQGGWDTLKGNADNDLLVGAKGRDVLQGGSGADIARAGADDDVLKGFDGNDELRGGSGDDLIKGAKGRDRLFGNAGDDFLDGGPGKDRCRGGRGRDIRRSC